MHPAYDIYFVYFKPDSPSRVVKFAMTDMHKIKQGGIYMGDPMKMSPALGIPQAEKWYEFFTGKKKKFDTPKCGQFALYKVYEALEQQPGANLKSSKGTWWGAVNAVTYVVDHKWGHDRDAAMHNAWFGARASLKNRAMVKAIEYAKAA